MGTDIHCFAERRGPRGWEPCYAPAEGDQGSSRFLDFYCGQERNYELFAVLAGVRRLTNDGFEPIRPPRGLPGDLSPAVRAVAEGPDGVWGHNHTWLTLRELLDYPWQEQKRTIRIHVDAAGFRQYQERGRPDHGYWFLGADPGCAGGPGASARPFLITNEAMARLIEDGQDTDRRFTEVTFEQPVATYCEYFLGETIPLLRTLGAPEGVRIVLWFDS